LSFIHQPEKGHKVNAVTPIQMRSFREIPILAMTGLYTRHEVKRCLQAGCNDVLLKPFPLIVLDKTLEALADRAPQFEAVAILYGSTEHAVPSGHLFAGKEKYDEISGLAIDYSSP
jgi:DNA-binding response OmpR family regulator